MNNVKMLAKSFREAIDKAVEFEELKKDCAYSSFPEGCCGDTSDLLAEYLLEHGIKTQYVCGTYIDEQFNSMRSHAWLCTEDGTIIDITGDQFKDESTFLNYNKTVYVGQEDKFHQLFEVDETDIRESSGISDVGEFCFYRLRKIYDLIKQNI